MSEEWQELKKRDRRSKLHRDRFLRMQKLESIAKRLSKGQWVDKSKLIAKFCYISGVRRTLAREYYDILKEEFGEEWQENENGQYRIVTKEQLKEEE